MSGVYNRKLFRQSSARDELRKMGGIMASSEELMREAMRTAEQAPRPMDLGPMPAMQQPMMPVMQPQQPMMQPQQPMDMGMQQPMDMGMQQPMDMGMQQPMDMGMQQPMDMGMQQPMDMGMQPAFMPPGVPQSVQPSMAPPSNFAGGGFVILPGTLEEAPDTSLGGIDVGTTAGSVVDAPSVDLDEDLVATAKDLEPRLEDEPPYAVANKILAKAEEKGVELTGDVQSDLAGVYQQLTGDPAAYEKNIDALNRGIIGAAIGAGTSARATENISKGLLVGLESAKATEERRVANARALQLAQLEAQAAASRKSQKDNGSRAFRNPIDAYQDAYQSVMNAGEFDLELPEGVTREQYADQVANDLIRRSYSAEQLVGTPFEGISAPTGNSPTQGGEDVLQSARAAIAAGADEAAVRERLQGLGIDPERL